jgi:hypothetical protein
MPQAPIVTVLGALSAKAAAAAAFKAAVWAAVKKVAVSALINIALAKAAQMLIGKPRVPRPSQDVEYSGTIEARRIIYGEMLCGGMNAIPPLCSGSNNDFLHQVMVVAGHECNSLGQVYFNRDAIGTITAITGNDDDGKVTSGRYSGKAWVRRYAGTDSQTVDFKLTTAFSQQWTAAHRGRGVAYLALTYEFDEDTYRQGKPEVTCLVQGKKVYDPRLDGTRAGGSGSHRVNDPTTWAYSTNPALCLADYLIDARLGLGEDAARVDYDLVADAADICDETVTVPAPTSTQKRYTCNVVLNATDRFEDNIEVLAQAMAGVCYYSGGRWRMFAGAWQTTSFTLGVDDLVEGGIRLVTAFPYEKRHNSVRGTFIDPSKNWQKVEFRAIVNTTYITADGEQTWLDADFSATTNEYEAQRHAILLNRRSRLRQSATLRCNMAAYGIRPFETGTITIPELGWSAKTVRCEGWNFDPSGFVEIVVREEASTDWNDPLTTDYLQPGSITTPTPTNYVPSPPTAISTVGMTSGIYFSWTPPAGLPGDASYELFEHTSSTPFSSATLIWSGNSSAVFIAKPDTTVRYYWVRVKMPAGGTSTTEPPVAGAAGSSNTVGGTLGAAAAPSAISKTDSTSSITTVSTTVTPTGGTAPYTYAWTRISGSTLITANSASSATTTFTGTPLVNNTTYDAVFRCTVTDNVAATKTVDVSVSIRREAMSLAVSPTTLVRFGSTSTLTTNTTTATPTGGSSPYTYAWTKVSGDTLTVTASTSATTAFQATGLSVGDSRAATYRCTVTDSAAATATADVIITIERTD